MNEESNDAVKLALDFVQALTKRKYEEAFSMTSADFVEEGGYTLNLESLREKFESIVSVRSGPQKLDTPIRVVPVKLPAWQHHNTDCRACAGRVIGGAARYCKS